MGQLSKDNTSPRLLPRRPNLAAWLLRMAAIPVFIALLLTSFDSQAQMEAEPIPNEANSSTPTPTPTPTATPTVTSTPYYVCEWVFEG